MIKYLYKLYNIILSHPSIYQTGDNIKNIKL